MYSTTEGTYNPDTLMTLVMAALPCSAGSS